MLSDDVAKWLRGLMGEKTQGAFAKETGVSRETVNSLLGGKVDADPGTLERIATACGVPVPTVEVRFLPNGGHQEPRTPVGWIGEARVALDRAERLLRGQPRDALAPAEAPDERKKAKKTAVDVRKRKPKPPPSPPHQKEA